MRVVTNIPPKRRANPKAIKSVVSVMIVAAVAKIANRNIEAVASLKLKAVTVAKAATSSKSLVRAHNKTAKLITNNKARAAAAKTATVAEVVVDAVEVIAAAAIKKRKLMAIQRPKATTLTAIAPSHKQARYWASPITRTYLLRLL